MKRNQNLPPEIEVEDVQGIILHDYDRFPAARFLLLSFPEFKSGLKWLLQTLGEITTAAEQMSQIEQAVNIALGRDFILQCNFPKETHLSFPREFIEGMSHPNRSRFLGDMGINSPENWEWGHSKRSPSIHVALLLYAESIPLLEDLSNRYLENMSKAGIQVVRKLDTVRLAERKEHFGFRDGISQPGIRGTRPGCTWEGKPMRESNLIMPGEFIFGYENEYGIFADSPTVPRHLDPKNHLSPDRITPSMKDLGRNGSMLVMRQLQQDVVGFWKFMNATVASRGSQNTATDMVRLASKMIGRWPNGAPMTVCPQAPSDEYADFDDFGYAEHDFEGFNCPLGSHIRRTNPRDNFLRNSSNRPKKDREKSKIYVKRFRIIRRGRPYGPPLVPSMDPEAMCKTTEDGVSRGMHFISIGATLRRQFELIQQSWAMDPTVNDLYEDSDPILGTTSCPPGLGSSRTFTEQAVPFRRKIRGIPQFTMVKGGMYFFIPGIRTLQYLASCRCPLARGRQEVQES